MFDEAVIDRSARPDFVGSQWCGVTQGLSYERAPTQAELQLPGEWFELIRSFEALKHGHSWGGKAVVDLTQSRCEDLAICAWRLVGQVGSLHMRHFLRAQLFSMPESLEVREAQYEACVFASDTELISGLLHRLRRSISTDEKQTIRDAIADILGPAAIDLRNETRAIPEGQYESGVLTALTAVQVKLGSTAVFRGEPRTVALVASLTEDALKNHGRESQIGNLVLYVSVLEAMTGVASTDVFTDELELRPLVLCLFLDAVRRTCRDQNDASRRFFGHLVK